MNHIEAFSQGSSFPSFPLENALNTYTRLFLEPDVLDPNNITAIAKTAVELSQFAKLLVEESSLNLKKTADDLEGLLKAPLSLSREQIPLSLLTAAENHLKDPEKGELAALIQEISSHQLALKLFCEELSLLSHSIHSA
ncbi:MAG: hypothetical protein QRY71_04855 [Candidatus Rhabdochlamydia sp.]